MKSLDLIKGFISEAASDSLKSERIEIMHDIYVNFWEIRKSIIDSFFPDLAAYLTNYFPPNTYDISYKNDITERFDNICIWKKEWTMADRYCPERHKGLICYFIESEKQLVEDVNIGFIYCNNKIKGSYFPCFNSIKIDFPTQHNSWCPLYFYSQKYSRSSEKGFLSNYVTASGKEMIFNYYKSQLVMLKTKFEPELDIAIENYKTKLLA